MTTESDDLGLGPGVNFTFGDVAMFDALDQVVTVFGESVLADYRELKVRAVPAFICFNPPQ